MANQLLLDEFLKALQKSKSFQLLDPDEQAALTAGFIKANDDQLIKALAELKKDAMERGKLEMDLKEKEQKQIQLAEEIKKTFKKINRKKLEKDEQEEAQNSEEAAEMLLRKLTQNF